MVAPAAAPIPPAAAVPPVAPAAAPIPPAAPGTPYYGQPGWTPMGPPPSKGVNPLVFIIGGLVIVALIVGGIVAFGMSKNNSSSGSPSASGSHPAGSPSAGVTPTAAATTSAAGSLTFSPSTVDCANPVDFTTTLRLPASVKSGDKISIKFDGASQPGATISESSGLSLQSDGSWLSTSTATISDMQTDCNRGGKNSSGLGVLTAGVHTYQIYDASGALLASGSYTVTGTTPAPNPTPTAAPSAISVTYSPSTLSCSAPTSFTITIRLPASVQSGDTITEKIDGTTIATGSVTAGSTTIHEVDGTWTITSGYSTSQIQTICDDNGKNSAGVEVLTPGSHTIQIYDSSNAVISEGTYTAQN